MKRIFSLTLMLAAVFTLQGCMNAGITGANVVYNRYEIGKTIVNHHIASKANQMLRNNRDQLPNSRISVTAFRNDVLMVGQAPSQEVRKHAENMVRSIPGIKRLYNEVEVRPLASLVRESEDAWITAKIKARFIAENNIDPDGIKVVTENGVVYLLGHVPRDQARLASYLARHTSGVKKVVRGFRYLKLEDVA